VPSKPTYLEKNLGCLMNGKMPPKLGVQSEKSIDDEEKMLIYF